MLRAKTYECKICKKKYASLEYVRVHLMKHDLCLLCKGGSKNYSVIIKGV